ncbi:hypothetical protein ACJJTC_005953 [Scirpophaga incertulas]
MSYGLYKITTVLLLRYVKLRITNSRSAVDLAYKIHGDCYKKSIPIIVLHGLLGSKRNWDSISKRMATELNTCTVVADARNHGQSPHNNSHTYLDLAMDVSKLMTTLKIKKSTIVGHSMGGRTAMVLALTQPDVIHCLVIVDISPIPRVDGALKKTFPNLMKVLKSVKFDGAKNISQARDLARKQILASGQIKNLEEMSFLLINIAERPNKQFYWLCNLDVLGESFQYIASFPKEMGSKKFNGPTLFIGGGNSDYIVPTDLHSIKNLFPEAELKYIPGAGHNVHAENPTKFFEIVKEFLLNNK